MIDISQIVAPLTLQADEQVEWPPVRLRVRTYLATTLPPLVKDRVYLITGRGLKSAKGEALVHPQGAYTLNEIPR